MVRDLSPYTDEQVAAVAAKLQVFFESLDDDERIILQALLLDCCGNPEAARRLLLTVSPPGREDGPAPTDRSPSPSAAMFSPAGV
jgi:hypothetical protein